MLRLHLKLLCGLLLLVMLGCAQPQTTPVAIAPTIPPTQTPEPTETALPSATPAPTATQPPTSTPAPTATATAASTATPTTAPTATSIPTNTPTATPDPYADLTIAALAERAYGGGEVVIEETLEINETFTRYLVKYPSDGLTIYGFINVPNDGWNLPVALVLHGYIDPDKYETEAYSTRYADALAEAGYFVFHPNYRNYPPSDSGPDPYRIGYATDILNLLAIIQTQSQDELGTLRRADASQVHMMGHSMGGGMALRVATVRPNNIAAIVLYGAMSGDEQQNYEKVIEWTDGRVGPFELAARPDMLAQINPIDNLDRLEAAVAIHHSAADQTVPIEWSQALCDILAERQHSAECFWYSHTPHTFNGAADEAFMRRMIRFFDDY